MIPKILQMMFTMAYLMINVAIIVLVRKKISPEISFAGLVDFYSLGALVVMIQIDRLSPRWVSLLQVGLVFPLFYLSTSHPDASLFFFLMIGLLKIYAVVSLIKKVATMSMPTKWESVPEDNLSGKDFYNSSAWRKLRYQVLAEDGRVCVACGENRVYNEKGVRIRYHVDHIKPRSLYPELALSRRNMQVMCECCNLGKSNKWEIDHRVVKTV